ncbi:hypothetical protein PIIN_08358 [Serendipita indica DSM 11827]|uniref:Uncharacterized protein n=1 Tax=Serendipita indica (strain DSM 11827) TaxID=1109443 RepID=G4TSW3_SERID|nr:hypothetical protein PIIN_08358 [Serendipita indica DSM 11827]
MHPSPEHPLKNGDMFAHLQDATAGSIESKGIANANDFLPVADIRRGGLSPSLPTPQDISIWNPNAMSQYNITESVTPFNLLGEAAFFWDPSPVGGKSSGNDTLGPTSIDQACQGNLGVPSDQLVVVSGNPEVAGSVLEAQGSSSQPSVKARTQRPKCFVCGNSHSRPIRYQECLYKAIGYRPYECGGACGVAGW